MKRYTMNYERFEGQTEGDPVWIVRDEDDELFRVFRTDREAALFIKENMFKTGTALELK